MGHSLPSDKHDADTDAEQNDEWRLDGSENPEQVRTEFNAHHAIT